jgi:diguanylate cyclase (GGDEF)-like protein
MGALFGAYVVALAVSGVAAAVSASVFRKYGEKYLFFSMIGLTVWCLALVAEHAVESHTIKFLLARVEYLGIYSSAPFLLMFAIHYSSSRGLVAKAMLALSWIGSCAAILLAFTNDLHHWLWRGIEPIAEIPRFVRFLRGPGFFVGVATTYSSILTTLVLLIAKAWRAHSSLFRAQSWVVLFGTLIPFSLNATNVFSNDWTSALDLSPIAFALTGAVLAFAVAKLRFFTVSPVARAIAFEALSDPIVVFDPHDRAVDANQAALALIRRANLGLAGSSPLDLFGEGSPLLGLFGEAKQARCETELGAAEGPARVFDALAIRLGDGDGRIVRLIDITDRKRAEILEHEQRVFAEGLRDVALTITTTMDPERVLDRVAEEVYRQVPCFAVNVMLADPEGRLSLAAARGDTHEDAAKWLADGRLSIADCPNFQIMADTGGALAIPDTSKCDYWRNLDPRIKGWVGAPIRIKGSMLGFINVDHDRADFYEQSHADKVKAFADLAAIVIHTARLFQENEELANVDPLTGLLNRRSFFARGGVEFERARRYGEPFAMLMMDFDDFKRLNDVYGHKVGDDALKAAAGALMGGIRPFDLCGRFGGDEFCVVMPRADRGSVESAAERLLELVRAAGAAVPGGLSVSVGMAAMRDAHAGLLDVLQDADRALYRAKRDGGARSSW